MPQLHVVAVDLIFSISIWGVFWAHVIISRDYFNFAQLFENLKNCTGLDFERGQWMKTTRLM